MNIRVTTSLFYGTVDIYASKNGEPTPASFLVSTASGILTVPTANFVAGDVVNVLIKASTSSKLQVIAASSASSGTPVQLSNGVPLLYDVPASGKPQTFLYTPHGPFNVVVVPCKLLAQT